MQGALEIKEKILEHFINYAKLFTPIQSDFLTGLYKRYQCLDNATLVLYFAKKTHQAILRRKDYDLNSDLSFENFWYNHSKVEITASTIINIAKNSNLPKETTRRKLSKLIKLQVLNKKNKHIAWLPSEEYKISYNTIVDHEIKNIAKLTKYVTDKINLKFSIEEIKKEYKKNFSFYWFHYLDLQLKWMKMWKARLNNDLEIALIFLQIASFLTSKTRQEAPSHKIFFNDPHLVTNIPDKNLVSVSATSIAEVTGIPRATCIRKLNLMAKQKFILQDKNTKRFYIVPDAFNKKLISKELTEKVTEIFSEFYSISIKALSSKTSK
jgi:hypothetical protein